MFGVCGIAESYLFFPKNEYYNILFSIKMLAKVRFDFSEHLREEHIMGKMQHIVELCSK
jgi:hypothetical protein